MSQKIERDHQRFRKIVRGKVKSDLGRTSGRGTSISAGAMLTSIAAHFVPTVPASTAKIALDLAADDLAKRW